MHILQQLDGVAFQAYRNTTTELRLTTKHVLEAMFSTDLTFYTIY